MKTQGEIEAAICKGIAHFEQEYMGRGSPTCPTQPHPKRVCPSPNKPPFQCHLWFMAV